MAHKHSVYDTDTHFSINPVTRALKNEASTKTALIQNDHNSERFTFELPRYIEGHDMSLCNVIQVHYNNIDANSHEQNSDVYEVKDMQISPEDENVVICSWLISHNATKYVGNLAFLLRFSCVEDDGRISYAWNTAICSVISVSSGIYNTEMVYEEYSDILEAWKNTIAIDVIEKTSISTMLNPADVRKAGTYILKVGGESLQAGGVPIQVYEVVPDDDPNLIIDFYFAANKGWNNEQEFLFSLDHDVEYGLYITKSNPTLYCNLYAVGQAALEFVANEAREAAIRSEEIANEAKEAVDGLSDVVDGLTLKGTASGDVIRIDDCAYGEHPVKVSVRGKNLIPYPYRRNEHITESASIVEGDNGGFIGNGTPNEAVAIAIHRSHEILDAWDDFITFSLQGEYENISMEVIFYDANETILWSTRLNKNPVTVSKADHPNVSMMALSIKREGNGLTMSGTAYPMVNHGKTADDYVPPIDVTSIKVIRYGIDNADNPQTYTPNADGTVDGVTSIAPVMTLTTDTGNAVLNVEYCKDINKADYVKKTDYAGTDGTAGIIKLNKNKGVFRANLSPELEIVMAERSEILDKKQKYKPIAPVNLDYAVKVGITTNTETLTDDEQVKACEWLGASRIYEYERFVETGKWVTILDRTNPDGSENNLDINRVVFEGWIHHTLGGGDVAQRFFFDITKIIQSNMPSYEFLCGICADSASAYNRNVSYVIKLDVRNTDGIGRVFEGMISTVIVGYTDEATKTSQKGYVSNPSFRTILTNNITIL